MNPLKSIDREPQWRGGQNAPRASSKLAALDLPSAASKSFAFSQSGRLKGEFCGKLNIALEPLLHRLATCRGDRPERTGAYGSRRIVELRSVEEIEEFRTHLQNLRFGNVGILDH